jgi:hypothetical protein
MSSVTTRLERREIPLNRRVAILTGERIDVRPARSALVGPLLGLVVGVGCALAIWFGMSVLPLPLLAVLLIVAVVAIPFAGIGLVYALVGAHIVMDRAKQSATWQQGLLGMGVGTTELVPFGKIERIAVEEAGRGPGDDGRPVEEFAQWRIVLVKTSGKRLEVGVVSAARPLSDEALARARGLAAAIAELSGARLQLPDSPDREPGRPPAAERRR